MATQEEVVNSIVQQLGKLWTAAFSSAETWKEKTAELSKLPREKQDAIRDAARKEAANTLSFTFRNTIGPLKQLLKEKIDPQTKTLLSNATERIVELSEAIDISVKQGSMNDANELVNSLKKSLKNILEPLLRAAPQHRQLNALYAKLAA
ncbi:hypothetical protein HY489_03740 [Candidatus Woesearchaeota archaeon]|nr:hypothetical protein [Candidatus Woesearchaeota archaeon]